jgi:hypothetical protein
MRSNTKLSVVLAALVIAVAIGAPAASARIQPPPPAAMCDPSAVPPPPSSIAASAAKEYAVLRACAGRYDSTTVGSAPVADSPAVEPTGFDWASAAIGAAAGTGLLVVPLALAAGVG